jgi:hypothetical protein
MDAGICRLERPHPLGQGKTPTPLQQSLILLNPPCTVWRETVACLTRFTRLLRCGELQNQSWPGSDRARPPCVMKKHAEKCHAARKDFLAEQPRQNPRKDDILKPAGQQTGTERTATMKAQFAALTCTSSRATFPPASPEPFWAKKVLAWWTPSGRRHGVKAADSKALKVIIEA